MAVSPKAHRSALLLSTSLLLLAVADARATSEPPARYRAKLPAISADRFPASAEVNLYVETNAYGYVTHIEIRSATDAALGEFCATAVRQWRYAPAREYGQPVAARFIQPFRFTGGRMQVSAAHSVPSPKSTDSR